MYLTNLFIDDEYQHNPMCSQKIWGEYAASRPIPKYNINRKDPVSLRQAEIDKELKAIIKSMQKLNGFIAYLNKNTQVVKFTYLDKPIMSFFRSNYMNKSKFERVRIWQAVSRIIRTIEQK